MIFICLAIELVPIIMETLISIAAFTLIVGFIVILALLVAYVGMRSRVKKLEDRVSHLESQTEKTEELTIQEEKLDAVIADSMVQAEGDTIGARASYQEFHEEPATTENQSDARRNLKQSKYSLPDFSWTWFEDTVGKRWMTWVGALALFLSCGFFLKHAFDSGWIGPTGRVVLGLFSGCVLLFLGDNFLRKRMSALGQGLMGAGLAILYVSIFAGFSIYKLMPQSMAFGSMVVVTAAGMCLAVFHNALPLGFIAVLGGFLTPPMLSTGRDPRDALFAYILLLDLGVLGVAFFKTWRPLSVLAFAGSWLIFAGWYTNFYKDSALAPTLMWASTFYLIFLLIPFVYKFRKREATTIEQFGLSLSNAVVAFTIFYILLYEDYKHALGFMSVAMSASYLILAYLTRTRIPGDTKALFGFAGMCVVFLTLAVPLHLKFHGVTMAWSVEGPVLVFLGYIFRYRPVRIAGMAVLLIAAFRLFAFHWPLHKEFYYLFWNTRFAAAISIALASLVYSIIHYRNRDQATTTDKYLMAASAIFGAFLALIICHAELDKWLQYKSVEIGWNRDYLRLSTLEFLWSLGALGFIAASFRFKFKYFLFSSLLALLVAAIIGIGLYGIRMYEGRVIFLNLRFASCAFAATILFLAAYTAIKFADDWDMTKYNILNIILSLSGLILLMLLSAEVYTYFYETSLSSLRGRRLGQMSLSAVWGLYAIVAIVIGFIKELRPLRLAGLGLLAVTALKAILLDLAGLDQIYRIISFVILGAAMIAASFLYHRLEKRDTGLSSKGIEG